jgi:5-methylcytosine-specific restriction endonuclease McrA
MDYKELLLDHRWKEKAYSIKRRDKFTCRGCKRKNRPLHVHHKHYIKNYLPWEYNNKDLYTLCEVCHKIEHHTIRHQMMFDSIKEYNKATKKKR